MDLLHSQSPFGGIEVRVSHLLVERVQHSRSPSRARRRLRLGHPQHVIDRPQKKAILIDGVLYVHPVSYAAVRAALQKASA